MSEFKKIFQTYKRTTLLSVVTIICWMCEVSLLWLDVESLILHTLPIVLPIIITVGLSFDYLTENNMF